MRAKLRAEYNRTLDCFLGVLMLFPASDLTKANVDLLPSKASKRGPGSRSSRSSKSSLPGRFLEEFRLQKPRESSHNPMEKSSKIPCLGQVEVERAAAFWRCTSRSSPCSSTKKMGPTQELYAALHMF